MSTRAQHPTSRLLLPFTTLLISGLLTALLYWQVLEMPFVFDDVIHLRWMEDRTLWRMWSDIRGMQHYRPLAMTIWFISGQLFGATNAFPLHLFTLLLHIANGCLVGWLAYRVTSRWPAPLIATALFVTFPWSYQVMPSPGSQSKPLSAFLILLGCWLYWRGRDRENKPLIAAGLISAGLAPFAYESAITSGGYLLLVEWLRIAKCGTEDWQDALRKLPRWAWALPALGIPFLIIWTLVPNSYDPVAFPGFEALWQSSVYFCQGLVWPVALLAKPLMRYAHLSDLAATAWVSTLTLQILIAYCAKRQRTNLLIASLTWMALSLGVQWLTLSFRYVIDGPRILYTSAAGIALLWAGILCDTDLPDWRRWPMRALTSLAVIAMTAWGARFALERMALVQRGLGVLDQATEYALAAKPSDKLLFVNMPAWITVAEPSFALGHEGYTLLPPYHGVTLGDYVAINTGVRRQLDMISLPDVREEYGDLIGYHGPSTTIEGISELIQTHSRVYALRYGERLGLRNWGGLNSARDDSAARAIFGEAMKLQAVSLRRDGDQLGIKLGWHGDGELEGPYTVFVHLYAPDGHLLSQADGAPIGGMYPFTSWRTSEYVLDVRYIPIQDIDMQNTVLGIGLYRSDTGERAFALDATRNRLVDDVYRQPVQVDER